MILARLRHSLDSSLEIPYTVDSQIPCALMIK
jgi:hypothetical protein